jgi:hypothetical protein
MWIKPYPANVENKVSKWQMGFNLAFKGLSGCLFMWHLILYWSFKSLIPYLKVDIIFLCHQVTFMAVL